VKIDVNLDMLTISPNGQYIAYNSGNDFIEMYDISGKIIRLVARLQHQRVGDIAFSPCGSKIASCSDDQQVGEVILWDLKDIENITKEILLSNIECGRIFFSADGENISVTDSQGDHSSSNTFRDRIVTLLNINTKAIKKLSPYYYYKTQIFPDKSSLIKRETYDHENRRYTTTIVDKNGEERAIFSEHTHAPSINKNYILACHEGRGKLFDHTMNCITQFSYGNPQNKIIRFKLYKEDSIKENVIYGRLSWSTGRKTDEAFYWQIPTETTMETVKSINKSLTTQQLLCLEAICSQKRFPKQHLLLKGDIRKSFLSFNAAKQEFLKTQLLVIY